MARLFPRNTCIENCSDHNLYSQVPFCTHNLIFACDATSSHCVFLSSADPKKERESRGFCTEIKNARIERTQEEWREQWGQFISVNVAQVGLLALQVQIFYIYKCLGFCFFHASKSSYQIIKVFESQQIRNSLPDITTTPEINMTKDWKIWWRRNSTNHCPLRHLKFTEIYTQSTYWLPLLSESSWN